jgi:hypothetical protein
MLAVEEAKGNHVALRTSLDRRIYSPVASVQYLFWWYFIT